MVTIWTIFNKEKTHAKCTWDWDTFEKMLKNYIRYTARYGDELIISRRELTYEEFKKEFPDANI